MDTCETVKVKPWGKDQGDHVLINADDFDPKVHTLIDEPKRAKAKG
jgi:predicted transcriptional regulator